MLSDDLLMHMLMADDMAPLVSVSVHYQQLGMLIFHLLLHGGFDGNLLLLKLLGHIFHETSPLSSLHPPNMVSILYQCLCLGFLTEIWAFCHQFHALKVAHI